MNSNETVTSSTDVKQATSDIKQQLNDRYDELADLFAEVEELIDKVGRGEYGTLTYAKDEINSALNHLDSAIADINRCSD